ncbi:MAG TPA: elongation factor P lysine(34) lysyltransferase [Legionellales bacterium]|nr:elongation factor P lysine(34) lysyltransferase [Legionellales bacterium]
MNWRPSCTIEAIKQRNCFMGLLREFFQNRAYLEVETPYMAKHGVTDLHLSNIKAYFRGQEYALQTSPEYHMKRLLAAGSGPIFQIARVFRDDEFGRWHNPEFTMLEWYQLGVDHHYLIAEIEQLFKYLGNVPDFIHLTYQEAFLRFCGFDPFAIEVHQLSEFLIQHGLENVLTLDESLDQHLHLLMAMVVEPGLETLSCPVVITDFPASQAALAVVEGQKAHRFEVYWQGVELANGFHELTDARLQRLRFEADNQLRVAHQLHEVSLDEQFLAALDSGLPPCSGVALGLDRLFALLLQKKQLSEVLSFSHPDV